MQKCGTTALDHFLRLHPQISMARSKEPHYFDDDTLDWLAPDYALYHRHFDTSRGDDVLRGEATPILTYWPNALERVAAYNPNARVLICLRHPAFRAFSHWRMEHHRGDEVRTFAQAIGEPLAAGMPGGVHRVYSYIERGFYAPQIENAQRLFSQSHVFVLRADRLWLAPEETLRSACDFLEIDAFPEHVRTGEYRVSIDTRSNERMTEHDRTTLGRLYAADIRKTATLTGIELDDWLEPTYREPMPA